MNLLSTRENRNQPACSHYQQSIPTPVGPGSRFFCENSFNEMFRLERMRQNRSDMPFLLGILDIEQIVDKEELNEVTAALFSSTRDIDLKGWLKCMSVIGVLVTETGQEEIGPARKKLLQKIRTALKRTSKPDMADRFVLIPMLPRNKMPASVLEYYVHRWTSFDLHSGKGTKGGDTQSGGLLLHEERSHRGKGSTTFRQQL